MNSASVPTGDRRPQNQRNAAAAQSLRRQVGIKSTSNLRLHERVQPLNRRANEAPDGGMMASTPGGKFLYLRKFREIDFNIKIFPSNQFQVLQLPVISNRPRPRQKSILILIRLCRLRTKITVLLGEMRTETLGLFKNTLIGNKFSNLLYYIKTSFLIT